MGKKVFFVCSGNTCRSPLAEAFARHFLKLDGEAGWTVISAGLSALAGSPATPEAVTVAGEFGLDLSGHRARQLTGEMLDGADLVLVMTAVHKARVLEKGPHLAGKVWLVKEYVYGAAEDVVDPFGGNLAVYRAMSLELEKLTAAIVKKLRVFEK
ncbi:MAG: Protein-arginine-phosphatase [Syntrophomonadaceae bacterium]|nr:Protein-arginine-phosphatase [Bacillota bacterium]